MKIAELVPMVEYYALFTEKTAEPYRYRINEIGVFESKVNTGWFYSYRSYNELMSVTFKPCEWAPKLHERYFAPSPSHLYFFDSGEPCLCARFSFNNDDTDNRVKKNVGWYKTAKEAHAKSLEMGWTL